MRSLLSVSMLIAAIALLWIGREYGPAEAPRWTDAEVAAMSGLSLDGLSGLPDDSGNRVADDPRAARFGHALFFDARLSGTGTIACTTCHQPTRGFTDGLRKAQALGTTRRHTPSILGAAFSPWLYWDGRRDSLWAQALTPLEDADEHGGTRIAYARLIHDDPAYRPTYEALFGAMPDLSDRGRFPEAASPLGTADERRAWTAMPAADRQAVDRVFSNIGKAIAAYERRLVHGPSRFDRYVSAVLEDDPAAREIFSTDEAQGLRLFLGKARCTECHNGPLLTNNEFHNTGILAAEDELPDRGRIDGLTEARADPFNCRGEWNDDADPYCGELNFAREGVELIGAVRTPSLRNLDGTAPYMHKGQLASLEDVIEHYNEAPLAMIGHNEAEEPLSLSRREQRQLVAFLHTLASPPADPRWLDPPSEEFLLSEDGTRNEENENR